MRQARRTTSERGAASLEMVVLLPALFTVLFLGMQAALYFHARTIAIAAAQEGARAAAAENANPGAGITAAHSYLTDAGDALESPTASARRTATTATVTVRGRSMSVIPGWHPAVRQYANVEIERVTAPSRGFATSEDQDHAY